MGDDLDSKYKIKETEFDSSVATLMRIDTLIKQLHSFFLNWRKNTEITTESEYKEGYLDTQFCIFTEGQEKFTKEERDECFKAQNNIITLKNKWGGSLFHPTYTDPVGNVYTSPSYSRGWSEIKQVAKKYTLYLMSCLDKHNMLLKTAKGGIQRFRGR